MAVKNNTIEIFKYIYTNKAMCINMEWSPISGLKFAYFHMYEIKRKEHMKLKSPTFYFQIGSPILS